jgi:hypothetical protein
VGVAQLHDRHPVARCYPRADLGASKRVRARTHGYIGRRRLLSRHPLLSLGAAVQGRSVISQGVECSSTSRSTSRQKHRCI